MASGGMSLSLQRTGVGPGMIQAMGGAGGAGATPRIMMLQHGGGGGVMGHAGDRTPAMALGGGKGGAYGAIGHGVTTGVQRE
jgi:hypothetical protein